MKRILLIFFFCLPILSHAYIMEYCSNACPSNCDYWVLMYEVNSDCQVTAYESWHYYSGNPTPEYNNHIINPGYLGMDVRNLGCDCEFSA